MADATGVDGAVPTVHLGADGLWPPRQEHPTGRL
jgi:hypothetical protein